MRKRCLSILLVLALCLAYVPVNVFAEPLAFAINSNAALADAFTDITLIGADSYTLNINADGLTYATAANFGDKTVIFNLNGNTLTLDTVTFNGSLTINGAGTLDADFQAGDNAELIFQNGVTLNNNDIQMPGNSPSVTLNHVSGTIDALNMNSTNPSLTITNSTLTINDLEMDGGEGTLEVDSSTLTCGAITWQNDNAIQLTQSTMTATGTFSIGYSSVATTTPFAFDGSSKIILEDPTKTFGNKDADWLATALNSGIMADHFNAVGPGDGSQAYLTMNNVYPDESTEEASTIVLKSSFEKADASAINADPRPYTGTAQALFSGTSADGTLWVTEDDTTVAAWTKTLATYTDVTDVSPTGLIEDHGGYIIVGDAEHDNSDPVTGLTIGLTKAEATVYITGNHEVVPYDGAAHTVADYTSYTTSVIYNLADFNFTGTATITQTGTGTGTDTYYMNLSATDFHNTNDNFDVAFEIEEDGYLVITTATIVTVQANNAEKTYGEADPEFTATVTPNVAVEYTFTRTAGENEGSYVLEPVGDAEQGAYYVTYATDELTINQAPGITLEAKADATMTAGSTLPTLYNVTSGEFKWDDEENFHVNVTWIDPLNTAAAGEYRFEIGTFEFDPPALINNYVTGVLFTETQGTLTITGGGGGGGGGDATEDESLSYDFTKQDDGIGSFTADEEHWTWGERAELSEDLADFYKVLSENSVPAIYSPVVVNDKITITDPTGNLSSYEDNYSRLPGGGSGHEITSFLASDDAWVLPEENPDFGPYDVNEVLVCQDNEPIYTANGDGKVDQSTFGNSNFFAVGVGTGDMNVDYPNLKTGDVVTNKTFNGVFVTKLQKSNNPTFDADLAKLKSDTIASFRAFELDHPEVFWLNGSIKLRVLTVTISGVQTSFIFMTLVDDGGFTMRIADYAAAGAIENGIKQRDAAVAAIIAQIPAGASAREKIVNLNKWFTMNNEYNRSADLSSIGYTPHRSLKSLTGNFGINGPVCDGYSRGFKTVCDRLGIPVILDTGVASIGSHSELHMWMRIQIDGTWYGTDCTWDDPIVKGKDGKVSGYENEKYLLVGNDTVVDGQKFGISHPASATPGGVTGVLFASIILSADEINGYTAIDYDDVKSTDWFFNYVQDVSARGLMNGTSTNLFSPQGTATRGQIVQILYNIAGQPEVEDVKVEGWFGVPATWAMDKGIVAGYPDGDFHGNDPVTREQLATILWAFEGAPEQSGELSFADADKVSSYAVNAMLWAKKEGLIGGKPGNLADPQGTATRAEIATIFSNYMK